MPGLSAMAIKDGRVVAQGAAGVRRLGDSTPLLISDRLNIASNTKWMTATLAGRLVERGIIRWETRVRDLFTNSPSYDAAFLDVTLEQLLANRGGVQQGKTFEQRYWAALMSRTGTIAVTRRWVAETVLKDPPEVAPGKYLYSNQGYTAAAVMMEIASGKTWEQLMEEEIFGPLKMTGASMGIVYNNEVPAKAPVGHDLPKGETNSVPRRSMRGERHSNYQASHGPGGFVACTFEDWAKFLRIRTGANAGSYLKPETIRKLQTPFKEDGSYALGVMAVDRPWAKPGKALTHNGDIFGQNTVIWMAPELNLIVMVFTHCRSADNSTSQALDDTASMLVRQFGHSGK